MLPKRIVNVPADQREKTIRKLNEINDRALAGLDAIFRRMDEVGKPILFTKANPIEQRLNPRIFHKLHSRGFVVYPTVEEGAGVAAHLVRYGAYLRDT